MDKISDFFYLITNQITSIGISDVVDIIVVALLLYYTFKFVRDRRAGKLAVGVILMLIILLLSDIFKLRATNFIMEHIIDVGLIALLIVFQPELRSMLEKVGGESLKGFKGRMDKNSAAVMRNTISEICVAAEKLSVSKTGALIVLERTTRLGDVIKTGTVLDATPSAFLLCNIFYDKAPLHDGAVIIRNSRIYAAGCFLTLSTNPDIIKDLGTRHRAAIGMSENSDAVVIVVSEETGLIGVAVEGDLKRGFSRKTLEEYITPFLISEQKEDSKRHLFGRKGGDGDGDDSKE